MEAAGLGAFMLSACAFGVLYEFPGSPVRQALDSDLLRRALMGITMGLTAVVIIYSPWGKQSGAHINPATTFTFLRLRKIPIWDAFFYIVAQFTGAAFGVMAVESVLHAQLVDPAVRYVATVPGESGYIVAFATEFLISMLLMSILHVSNHARLSRFTGIFAGALVALYITIEAPFSGMSMNPARTFGSAFASGIYDGFWIYMLAPTLGMLAAAEFHTRQSSARTAGCAKLHHENERRCIFCGANGGFENE
jgi:aquaporin Z